jgi:hypothetical protein
MLTHLGTAMGRASVAAVWPRAAGQRRVLVHTGLHKTGTTAIQQFLSRSAEQLHARGVLYPAVGRPTEAPDGHHNLAWELAGDRRFRVSAGTLDEAANAIADFPGDAILSSEDFETVLGCPSALARLLDHALLRQHAFTILFWVRDQASYVESLFFEMLGHGMAQEAGRFCHSVLSYAVVQHQDWTFHFDYQAIRRRLRSLPTSVAVRPYSRLAGNSSLTDFLAFAELQLNTCSTESTRINPRAALSDAVLSFGRQRLGQAWADQAAPQRLIAELVSGRQAHVSAQMRAALNKRFGRGNRRLARACGFPGEALAIEAPPEDGIALEALFSLQTQTELAAIADCGVEAALDGAPWRSMTGGARQSAAADTAPVRASSR